MTVSEKGHGVPVNQASDAVEQVESSTEVCVESEPPASENKSQSPYLVSGKPVHHLRVSDWKKLITFCVTKYTENLHLYWAA